MTVPIVDREDQIIGYKDRSDIDFSSDIFRTASLWITNSKGDVLLAQRKLDKKVDPGKWAEAVGGTVEGSDTYESTVIREAEEELGLRNLSIELGPKQFITTPCCYFVQWYKVVLDFDISDFKIQPEEVEQIAWLSHAQLDKELQTLPHKYIDAMRSFVDLFSSK